jgi:hypothetical protein
MFSTHAIRSRNQTDFAGGSRHPVGKFAPSEQPSRCSSSQISPGPRTHATRPTGAGGGQRHTALCFVLRAVNRILSDKDQPDRVTISRLWEVLDEPELNRAPRY